MDIKTAGRTLDVFEAFAAQHRPLRLSEVAALLEAPVSSCYQLIRTMQRRGYFYALNGKSYYPTKRMLKSAETIARHDPVLNMLGPALEALRDRTGESVILGQHAERNVMLVEVVESHHTVRYTARPGALRHLYSSALGKALLGAMTPEERGKWLPEEPFPAFTAATLTTRSGLEEEIALSKARGWYASVGETFPELHSVGIPVRFAGSLFALSVAGPVTRFAPKQEEHAAALLAAARDIDALLEKQQRRPS